MPEPVSKMTFLLNALISRNIFIEMTMSNRHITVWKNETFSLTELEKYKFSHFQGSKNFQIPIFVRGKIELNTVQFGHLLSKIVQFWQIFCQLPKIVQNGIF